MKALISALIIIAGATTAKAQQIVTNVTGQNDTVLSANIVPVTVLGKRFDNLKQQSDFYKLKNNVAIVYPYAKIAGEIYHQMKDDMDNLHRWRQKRRYKKDEEKTLRDKFTNEIKDLNDTQGEILFKLINRETGNNCYEVIKELKSPAAAFFYQIVAKHWGYDLKAEYKPSENRDLELIVQAMDNNQPIK